jgi:hypothetical protein
VSAELIAPVPSNELVEMSAGCFHSAAHFLDTLLIQKLKKKGKAIPLQAWTGPEGFRKLRLPDFKTIDT